MPVIVVSRAALAVLEENRRGAAWVNDPPLRVEGGFEILVDDEVAEALRVVDEDPSRAILKVYTKGWR